MKAFACLAAIVVLALLSPLGAKATAVKGTLDKIRANGTIVLGIRQSSPPLSYIVDGGHPIGYQIDVCQRVVEAVKARLRMPALAVRMIPVTSENRIAMVEDGGVDLECGSTTNSQERARKVAFSFTTFVASVRVAVKRRSGIAGLAQLDGKPVVTTAGSNSLDLLRAAPEGHGLAIIPVFGQDHAQSFAMLASGRAAAFAMDDELLAGLIAQAPSPGDYAIIGPALDPQPIALMLRKNDPEFKALVDDTLARMMKGGAMERLYSKWFERPIPPRGANLHFPLGLVLKNLFNFPSDDPVEAFRAPE